MGTWDQGLDYNRTMRLLLRDYRRGRNPCYTAILLVQLRNGCRVSEAVRGFKAFIGDRRVEALVRVSKARKPRERLLVLPYQLDLRELSSKCIHLLDVPDDKLIGRVKMYAKRYFNINTHSLRYAFITHLLREGVESSLVAKITGHANLNNILRYTQQKEAEDILRNLG